MQTEIKTFFEKKDRFLNVQFEQLLGSIDHQKVLEAHADLMTHVRSAFFEDELLESARRQWLSLLEGLTVNLGFSQLRNVSTHEGDPWPYLEKCRTEIDAKPFLGILEQHASREFEREGLALDLPPDVWLRKNDAAVDSTQIDPAALKDILLEISGYEPGQCEYIFRRSKSEGFFMMSLALSKSHFIGHGELNSVFRLSTFAHEIGHSTTLREPTLNDEFIRFPASSSDNLINNEVEAYAYEKLFAEHFHAITKRLRLNFDHSWHDRLLKRKAVQNNLHLLRNLMNYLFFSGATEQELSSAFQSKMKEIFPKFSSSSNHEWLAFSTLGQPISRIGYLKAYEQVFC